MRLLLVEDDLVLQDGLQHSFEKSGYAVDIATDGAKAVSMINYEAYDVIILDLGLPELSGFSVLSKMRAKRINTPVLILTAQDDIKSRVRGLDLGADDYLAKPFDLSELEARIRALIRRGVSGGSAILTVGSLVLNTESKVCHVDQTPLPLTSREYALLELFLLKTNKVISKPAIIDHLYNLDEAISENAIEANISRLRKKLMALNIQIETVRGMGYILVSQEEPDE